MKFRYACVLGLILNAGAAANSWADVDPSWLGNWNEAQKSRPLAMESAATIAAKDEPGSPLVIKGRVVGPDAMPLGGVVVHAYHRDSYGFEFGSGDRALDTWRLQGWAQTNAAGEFQFQTVRPAPDRLGREAAHVHFTLESKRYGRQWAPKAFLADDSLITKAQRKRSRRAGDYGSVREVVNTNGVQYIHVNIRLKAKGDF